MPILTRNGKKNKRLADWPQGNRMKPYAEPDIVMPKSFLNSIERVCGIVLFAWRILVSWL